MLWWVTCSTFVFGHDAHPNPLLSVRGSWVAQLLLRPFGFTVDCAPHESQNYDLSIAMKAATQAVHGTDYTASQSAGLYVELTP